MRLRLMATVLLVTILTLSFSAAALAHGENAQEAFLRTQTVLFYDVEFSGGTIEQNEPFTVTGKFKILETWPAQLGEPELAYVSLVAPGPVMAMKERFINGQPAPHSIVVEKGQTYSFEMTLEGRRVGRWHVHPGVGVNDAGTLIGPGQWVEITPAAAGFTNPLPLLSGETVDLENYGLSLVLVLSFIGFALGLWYMWYWIHTHRTITRLPVNVRLPLNDDGARLGITQPRDHRFVNMMALLSVVLLLGGWAYAANAYPNPIPQQVIRFAPEPLDETPTRIVAQADRASYDDDTHTLTVDVAVTNNGNSAVELTQFGSANVTFVRAEAGGTLRVENGARIDAGEQKVLRLTIEDSAWEAQNLIPFDSAQPWLAGVLFFEDEDGNRQLVTVKTAISAVHLAQS